MKKFQLLCLSACFLLLAPVSLCAAGIAVISHADITPYRLAIAGFREQVGLDVREYHLGVRNEHRDEVKTAIRQQQPELILALGKSALNFSREISGGTPVVFAFVLHPENNHLQKRESGIAIAIAPDQQFKMLLKIAPSTKTVGVVYDPAKSGGIIRQAKSASRKHGLTLVAMPVGNQKEAANAIAAMMPSVDAMWMIPDTTVLTSTTFRQMTRLSLVHAVALIGLAPKHVRAGSLFSLSFDSRAIGKQAGRMANRMLKGKKLSELVSPDLLSLVMNSQTADRLGLHIPSVLLKKAVLIYPERDGMQQ